MMQSQTLVDERKHEELAVLGFGLVTCALEAVILYSIYCIWMVLDVKSLLVFTVMASLTAIEMGYSLFAFREGLKSTCAYASSIEPVGFIRLKKFALGYIFGLIFLLIPLARYINRDTNNN